MPTTFTVNIHCQHIPSYQPCHSCPSLNRPHTHSSHSYPSPSSAKPMAPPDDPPSKSSHTPPSTPNRKVLADSDPLTNAQYDRAFPYNPKSPPYPFFFFLLPSFHPSPQPPPPPLLPRFLSPSSPKPPTPQTQKTHHNQFHSLTPFPSSTSLLLLSSLLTPSNISPLLCPLCAANSLANFPFLPPAFETAARS